MTIGRCRDWGRDVPVLHQAVFTSSWPGPSAIGVTVPNISGRLLSVLCFPAGGRRQWCWRPLSFSWGHSSAGEHRLCTAATWVQFPWLHHFRGVTKLVCGGLAAFVVSQLPRDRESDRSSKPDLPSVQIAAGRFHRGGGLCFFHCSRSPWRAGESR